MTMNQEFEVIKAAYAACEGNAEKFAETAEQNGAGHHAINWCLHNWKFSA